VKIKSNGTSSQIGKHFEHLTEDLRAFVTSKFSVNEAMTEDKKWLSALEKDPENKKLIHDHLAAIFNRSGHPFAMVMSNFVLAFKLELQNSEQDSIDGVVTNINMFSDSLAATITTKKFHYRVRQ